MSSRFGAAWGKSGNQPLYPQKFTNLTNTVYNNVNALRVALGAGDPNIKPETQTEIEGGFDRVGVWRSGDAVDDRVRQVDRRPDHPADVRAVRPASRTTSRMARRCQNRGIESMLQVTPLRFQRGEWNSTVIYQKVKPKITDLSVPTFRQGGFALFLGQYQVEEGKSPTQIVGLVPTVANPNVSAAAIVGNATPDYRMSFNNEVSFGPFHASALLDWRHGGDVINLTTFLYDAAHNSADWDTKGKERFALQGKDTRPYVEDGSFVKLREVSLSYRVPTVVRATHVARSGPHGRDLVQRPQSAHELRVQGGRSRGEQLREPGAQPKRGRRTIPAVALVLPLPRPRLLIMIAYSTMPPGRSRARLRAAAAIALGAAVLAASACKDTAEPDANNPSLQGVQDNPSRVTVTQMVRGTLEGYRLNSGFPLAFSIIRSRCLQSPGGRAAEHR